MTEGAQEDKLSGVQRFFTTVLFPFADSIERHSRKWRSEMRPIPFKPLGLGPDMAPKGGTGSLE
jgi:hypothetical protein